MVQQVPCKATSWLVVMFRRPSPVVAIVLAVLAIALLGAAARADTSVLPATLEPLPDEAAPVLGHSEASPDVALELIGEFVVPVEVTPWAEAGVSLVVEQVGVVRVLDATGHVVVDLSDRVRFEGEQGLLGAAVHPSEQLLYVHYIDVAGTTVVAEFELDPIAMTADPSSFRQVLTIEQPFDNHNGGEIDFGPDDYLYIGLGDGGLADDPRRLALDLTSPLGKILRIDPIATGDAAYSVPADNPFVDTAGADARVWSYGLRNPWKFSFDPVTGDLWIADVGQNEFEEINRAPAGDAHTAGRGLSFGWSAFEGVERFNDDEPVTGVDGDPHVEPYFTTSHDEGNCSISGGAVYRGAALPALTGWYVYADYCTGVISAISAETAETAGADVAAIDLARVDALVAIAAGVDRELYAASAMGTVHRLVAPGSG